MTVPRHICADAYRLHQLCSYGRECYIVLSVHYIAEPKVHSVHITLSTYANLQSPKKYHSSKKRYLHTVSNCPNVHHVSHLKSEKKPIRPLSHPKMEKFLFRPIHLHHLPQNTNALQSMPQKLNSSTTAIPSQSPSNSVALSQRIPSIFQ